MELWKMIFLSVGWFLRFQPFMCRGKNSQKKIRKRIVFGPTDWKIHAFESSSSEKGGPYFWSFTFFWSQANCGRIGIPLEIWDRFERRWPWSKNPWIFWICLVSIICYVSGVAIMEICCFFEVQCEFFKLWSWKFKFIDLASFFWFDRNARALFRNRPFLQWVCGFGGGAPMGSVREPQKVRVDVLDRAKTPPLQGCQSTSQDLTFFEGIPS